MRRLEDKEASVQPIKSKLKIRILDEGDVKDIVDTALRILEEIGIFFPHNRALQLLSDAGAKVDFKNQMVRISPDLVMENVKKAPRYYTLAARERPELDLKIDGESGTYFNNGGCASTAVDFKTGKKRPSRKEDIAKMARIVDYLSCISFFWPNVSATDYLKSSPLHELEAAFNNTEKHVQTETVMGEVRARYAVEMASVIAGGKDKLRERPILSSLICYLSPLAIEKEAIEATIVFAEAGIPVGFMSMPTMGATAPASQAGALAMGLAEVLSGVAFLEIVNPGCPAYTSIIPAVVDPRSGEYFYASSFSQMANVASVQLSHYVGVPIVAGASFGGSSYRLNDWQIGRENIYLPLLCVMAEADMCFSMGLLESVNLWNAARTLFDREIYQAIKIISSGIEVTDSTLSFDVVRRVGPKGHFLGQKETATNLPRLWPPSILFERSKQPEEKYRNPEEIAWEEVKWIIENHKVPQLDRKVKAEITKILKVAEKELV